MRVGVAISTHRRPEVLARSLAEWAKHMPEVLVVNHDQHGVGVAATKNRGITALVDAGCEHLFLADDDVWPTGAEWWLPYIQSPHPHLMYLRPAASKPYGTGHVSCGTPNGVLLYAEHHVIERVGGMRTEFGRHGSEHGEWSRRIHNAGLTPVPFLGLSTDPFHALDYEGAVESTVTGAERDTTWAHRKALRVKYRDSADFVPYREVSCTSPTS